MGVLLVSIWTPQMSEAVSRRWFFWPNILILSPVPIATAFVVAGTWRALNGVTVGHLHQRHRLVCAVLHGHRDQPVANDRSASLHARSGCLLAEHASFLLVGTLFLLPIVLVYSSWSYWVFRGKVRADAGYH
jgi:cytochrome d ubiquinol oxidase subunit II